MDHLSVSFPLPLSVSVSLSRSLPLSLSLPTPTPPCGGVCYYFTTALVSFHAPLDRSFASFGFSRCQFDNVFLAACDPVTSSPDEIAFPR